jgi:O-antigen ligase
VQFWVLAVFLTAVFFMGGSSRADVQSLIVLRPLAVLVCGYGILTIRREHFVRYTWVFGILLGWIALCFAQLVPLPPGLWQMLPKRNLVAEIDAAVGLGALWRPLSLAPSDTLNALFSLTVPFAVALLGAQLSDRDQGHLLKVLLGLGLVSGALGFAQAITAGNATLYFYELSNEGASTGLFSNRNHHALLLAMCFPMMAAYVARTRRRDESSLIYPAAIAVGLMLIPLILLSGSRGGLVLGIVAIGLSMSIVGLRTGQRVKADKPVKFGHAVLVAGAVMAIAVGAFALSRAEAIDRLAKFNLSEEMRFSIWQPTFALARDYLPWGSGIGTFVPIFQIHESTNALTLLYINHAHNELLELLLTGGLPAILLIALAIAKWGHALIQMLRTPADTAIGNAMMQAGLALLLLLFLGSIVDYPARTPALISVAVIAAIWAQNSRHPATNGASQRKK